MTRCHSSYCPNPWQTLPCHQNIQNTGVLIIYTQRNIVALPLCTKPMRTETKAHKAAGIDVTRRKKNAQLDTRNISKQQSFCTEALPAPQYHKESSLPAYEARKSRAVWHAAPCKQRKCQNLVSCKICNGDQSLESFTNFINGPWQSLAILGIPWHTWRPSLFLLNNWSAMILDACATYLYIMIIMFWICWDWFVSAITHFVKHVPKSGLWYGKGQRRLRASTFRLC